MTDDVLLNKAATIERCIQRIQEEYSTNQFNQNFTKQDSVILNLLRAIETAIDMANRVIRVKQLGLPQNSRDVFTLLEQAKLIDTNLCEKLHAMVGFRNIAVHDYTRLNLDIIKAIIANNLEDILKFSQQMLLLKF